MACIEGLLRDRLSNAQRRLKSAVGGLFGATVRGYLPQTWVIITDAESLTIHADKKGNMNLRRGQASRRDGTIKIGHDHLSEALRNKTPAPSGSYEVTFQSKKGRTAFNFLRRHFGL
ncbi:MAG: hypothetical protein KAW09_12685 [Thermoplasmata archaeon]|nr:hypothetical protein [Thermoplasmata archaeon]